MYLIKLCISVCYVSMNNANFNRMQIDPLNSSEVISSNLQTVIVIGPPEPLTIAAQ